MCTCRCSPVLATRPAIRYLPLDFFSAAVAPQGSHGLKFQEDDVYIERKAYEAAMAALRYSHVALMLIDGREGAVARTELSIASEVLSQGRALVVAVNKCDDIPSFEAARDGVEDVLSHQLAQGGDLTVVPISAIDGTNVDQLVCRYDTLRVG